MFHEPMKSILDFPICKQILFGFLSEKIWEQNPIAVIGEWEGFEIKVCKLCIYLGLILALVHELVFLIDPFH